ncbi:MAG: DUF871 domain-containing protein [Selenomonadaceae bacterium]|nr:DUF871 domain-containing protein [Selenomonadaceae bacterium]
MQNGISIYAGLDYDSEENLSLIETAADMGFKRLFTSAQIPETANAETFQEDLADILATATLNGFEIILDVNADNFSEYDIEGLTLRLDDGFTTQQISDISRDRKIMLNASTITEEFLNELLGLGVNFDNVSALHNFYPHSCTGLDTYFFDNQNHILHDFGVSVGAFIPSKDGKRRLPLREGLPTLEDCRNFSTDLSARFLAALDTDFIIIGDGQPTQEELQALAAIQDNEVILHAQLLSNDLTTAEILSRHFTRRADVAKSVIRAAEGRHYLKAINGRIPHEGNLTIERSFGDITVDNDGFGRYAGEVHIVQDILPADERVNIAAHLLEEEIFLMGYIKPRQKFSFKFV